MANSGLRADSRGFIVGSRRFEEMSNAMQKTENNTREILSYLKDQTQKGVRDSQGDRESVIRTAIESTQTAKATVKAVVESTKAVEKTVKKALDSEAGRYHGPSRNTQSKQRDSKGRFVGQPTDATQSSAEEKRGFANKLKSLIGSGKDIAPSNVNVRGVDPTVDAISELKDVVSPVTSVFSKMTAKTVSFFTGRRKKDKSENVLPEEHSKALKEDDKNSKIRNRFLSKILDAVRSGGGGGLLKLFGRGKGLLPLLMTGGKSVLKKVPLLGALFGGGMLAKDWGKLSSGGKGKGIGSIVGMLAGGAIGSIFGVGGTLAGGYIGEKLGSIFGEKVGKWTDDLRRIDWSGMFQRAVGSIGGFISNAGTTLSQKFGFSDSGDISRNKDERQLGMYNALRQAGFTDQQALALGGEIGRENDYGDIMFGSHIDPAKDKNGNDIVNSGVLSWNGTRGENFRKFMRERGLMDKDGKMPESQEALNAQADFIMQEMKSGAYAKTTKEFFTDKNAKQYGGVLAKYIGWARGQDTIRGANGTRVPFNSKAQEDKVNAYIDYGTRLVRNEYGEVVNEIKPKQVTSTPFKPTAQEHSPVKVKSIVSEMERVNSKSSFGPQSKAPSDSLIPQSVSDRGIAHVLSGGLGFKE